MYDFDSWFKSFAEITGYFGVVVAVAAVVVVVAAAKVVVVVVVAMRGGCGGSYCFLEKLPLDTS